MWPRAERAKEGDMSKQKYLPTRRGVLATGLAALAAPAFIRRAAAQTAVEIGYMPILPVSQAFVAIEEGWVGEAGVDPDLISFQNGPAMVQALVGGQLSVAHLGIGPAMVARARGVDIKVVAASIREQISFIAVGRLAELMSEQDPAAAFAAFAAGEGRKPVVTTFPRGSVPETVLQYWLRRQIAVDPSELEIIFQGAAQVQQALLTQAVDGAAILEPIVSVTEARVPGAYIAARGSEMFPGQPGAVLAMREGLIADQPEIVAALVAAHARATTLLRDDPAAAAPAVGKYVGGGRLPADIVLSALENSRDNWVSDPAEIIEGATAMRDFQAEIGTLAAEVDIGALIETRFHDALG